MYVILIFILYLIGDLYMQSAFAGCQPPHRVEATLPICVPLTTSSRPLGGHLSTSREVIRGITVSKVGLSHISANRSSGDLVFWVPYARAVEIRGATFEVGVGSVWTVKERELRPHTSIPQKLIQAFFSR